MKLDELQAIITANNKPHLVKEEVVVCRVWDTGLVTIEKVGDVFQGPRGVYPVIQSCESFHGKELKWGGTVSGQQFIYTDCNGALVVHQAILDYVRDNDACEVTAMGTAMGTMCSILR